MKDKGELKYNAENFVGCFFIYARNKQDIFKAINHFYNHEDYYSEFFDIHVKSEKRSCGCHYYSITPVFKTFLYNRNNKKMVEIFNSIYTSINSYVSAANRFRKMNSPCYKKNQTWYNLNW